MPSEGEPKGRAERGGTICLTADAHTPHLLVVKIAEIAREKLLGLAPDTCRAP